MGRFINADDVSFLDPDTINGLNLFAYCENDPVNNCDPNGEWSLKSIVKKVAIGVGAVLIGATVVAATAATGGAAAAFAGAVVAGLKAAAISGAIGAAVGAGTSAVNHRVNTGSWDGVAKVALNSAVDGFSDGFMTGGVMAGGSQVISGGFKLAANVGVPTGRNGGLSLGKNLRALSPNHLQAHEAGGTLLKIGSKYQNVRFDVGAKSLFHMNVQLAKKLNYHIPLGIIGSGIWGGSMSD